MLERYKITRHERHLRDLPLLSRSTNQVLWRGDEAPSEKIIDELVSAAQEMPRISTVTQYANGTAVDGKIVERSEVLELKRRLGGFFYKTTGLVQITPMAEIQQIDS